MTVNFVQEVKLIQQRVSELIDAAQDLDGSAYRHAVAQLDEVQYKLHTIIINFEAAEAIRSVQS